MIVEDSNFTKKTTKNIVVNYVTSIRLKKTIMTDIYQP
jgi:hypothetical protein